MSVVQAHPAEPIYTRVDDCVCFVILEENVDIKFLKDDVVVYVPTYRLDKVKMAVGMYLLIRDHTADINPMELGIVSSVNHSGAFVKYRREIREPASPGYQRHDALGQSQHTSFDSLINLSHARRAAVSNHEKREVMVYNKLRGIETVCCFEYNVDFLQIYNPGHLMYSVTGMVDNGHRLYDGSGDQIHINNGNMYLVRKLDEVFFI